MKYLSQFTAIIFMATLAACSTPQTPAVPRTSIGTSITPTTGNVTYKAVDFSVIPQWNEQDFRKSLKAFKKSCEKLQNQHAWQNVCQNAHHVGFLNSAARKFFEQNFTAWEVTGHGKLDGMVTGYYEPVLHGHTHQTKQARFPIYGIPNDLVSVPITDQQRMAKGTVMVQATGKNSGIISPTGTYLANLNNFPLTSKTRALKGRFQGNEFIPYYTREEINRGVLNGKAPIIGYADDPVELFFLHVQGSGRLKTPYGYIRLGFADKNDYPYVSIGRYMADKGYIALSRATMQNIKAYIQQNPHQMAEILGQNPSYVFFRKLDNNDDGPIGSLGVPLTSEYSGAVDRHYIVLGSPIFLATLSLIHI